MQIRKYIPHGSARNRATALTFTRFFGIVPLAPGMFLYGIYLSLFWGCVILMVFLALALTDYVDGKWARDSGLASTYGRQLDRMVDKCFAFYSLAFLGIALKFNAAGYMTVLFVGIVLFRFIQDCQGSHFNNLHPTVSSNKCGKAKTWVDDGAIATAYFVLLLAHHFDWSANWAALAACVILTGSASLARISLEQKRRL